MISIKEKSITDQISFTVTQSKTDANKCFIVLSAENDNELALFVPLNNLGEWLIGIEINQNERIKKIPSRDRYCFMNENLITDFLKSEYKADITSAIKKDLTSFTVISLLCMTAHYLNQIKNNKVDIEAVENVCYKVLNTPDINIINGGLTYLNLRDGTDLKFNENDIREADECPNSPNSW